MSRHAFGEILGSEKSLLIDTMPRDLKGYGLDEWMDFAVVGWDESLQTYFLHGPEEEDEPSWWVGTAYAEVPTFAGLCRVIRRIFGDEVEFEFVDRIQRPWRNGSAARLFGGNGDGASTIGCAKAAAAVEVSSLT